MKRLMTITATLCLAAGVWVAPADADEGGFSLGVQAAFSEFDGSTEGNSNEESGLGFGIAARYTVPFDDGFFIGLHSSLSLAEQAEGKASAAGDTQLGHITVEQKSEIKWAGDVLVRVGQDLGYMNVYGGVGLAFARGSLSYTGELVQGTGNTATTTPFNISVTGNHLGWKAVLGADFDLFDDIETFIQLEHADYGTAGYARSPLGVEIELEALAVRTGMLFRF